MSASGVLSRWGPHSLSDWSLPHRSDPDPRRRPRRCWWIRKSRLTLRGSSPDGRQVAYRKSGRLMLISVDGGSLREVSKWTGLIDSMLWGWTPRRQAALFAARGAPARRTAMDGSGSFFRLTAASRSPPEPATWFARPDSRDRCRSWPVTACCSAGTGISGLTSGRSGSPPNPGARSGPPRQVTFGTEQEMVWGVSATGLGGGGRHEQPFRFLSGSSGLEERPAWRVRHAAWGRIAVSGRCCPPEGGRSADSAIYNSPSFVRRSQPPRLLLSRSRKRQGGARRSHRHG